MPNAQAVKGSTEPRIGTPVLTREPVAAHEDRGQWLSDEWQECSCGCGLNEATSYGFECIAFLTLVLGWHLIPYQRWLYVHALEKNLTLTGLRFKTIVLLIARQNGKTQWLKGLALWKLYLDGAKLAIISAQNLDLAETTLAETVADVKGNKTLRKEYAGFTQTNGKYRLRLKPTKSEPDQPRVFRVQPATRKGGRSLSADLALLDELREHHTWRAWDAITPTTLTRKRSLVVAASNAGDATSVVLASLRKGAIKKIIARQTDQTRTALFEWSAPEDCDPLDPQYWPEANPALGYLFELDDLYGYLEAKEDDIAGWQTEYLCQWVLSLTPSVIPAAGWASGVDAEGRRDASAEAGKPWASVDVNFERTKSYISVAGWLEPTSPVWAGRPQLDEDDAELAEAILEGEPARPVYVETIAAQRGTDWLVPWFTDPAHPERLTRFAGVVVQRSGAPASSLIEELRTAGVPVVELGGADLTAAYADAHDLISEGLWFHRPSPALDAAAAAAVAKFLGDAWVIDRRRSPVDVAPIISCVQASWGLTKPPEPVRRSAYEDEGLTVV